MEIINQEEIEANLADAIVARTYEVHSYDVNIKNYETILSNNLEEWPERLIHLKNIAPQEAALQCDVEDIELLAKLQLFERASFLIKTEKIERAKAKAILDVLDSQLVGPNRETALQAAIDRRNSQTIK